MVASAGAVIPVTASSSAAAPAGKACDSRNNNSYSKLLECVSAEGVTKHLQAFQAIADANGGTRATETPGYRASVDYVVEVLEKSGWSADVVPFTYNATDTVLQQVAPTQTAHPHAGATGTGEGDVTEAVVPVDINLAGTRQNTSGCEDADFAGFPAGSIALLQRGGPPAPAPTCSFRVKALNAEEAGASAVIIFNQGDASAGDRFGVISPTLAPTAEDPIVVDIPVVGTSFAAGQALAQPGSRARVAVDFREVTDFNVIGELEGEVDDNVVMAGAHLDSVPAGPGINDNGSGSSGLLDVVEAMGNSKPHNTVRFAWWGAEEIGLLGSTAWVGQRTQAEKDEIALYLNFDMIGSPNYYFGIYDANESSFVAPVPVPEGSEHIEGTLESFYTVRSEPYDDSAFSGRSDYQAFINNGIPSGGLFTGAEVVKTPQQQAIWGGVAGESFDQCYHLACDTIDNVNQKALDVNSDAVAFAVLTYAYSTEGVNGVPGRKVPGKFTIPAPAGPEHTFAGPLGGDDGHDHDHEAEAS
ncbi:M28 family peptidase [Nocardioides renjunii]|uniref:M28 family peptidase n=1 Tax=Nocardioides renjunii TaxID=3095075 RepID=UPI002AFFD402|nr:M28 family peptidase [Nocardioides sp. S-34]WQQ20415.1 M20/M25/M40 family metallo-hydrolase [Nocardioides sp. S-34]